LIFFDSLKHKSAPLYFYPQHFRAVLLFRVKYFFYRIRAHCSQRPGGFASAAAYTTRHAGDKRSITFCLFCGVTAAVAQNRQLCEAFLCHFLVSKYI
jgi:hypothetical protein